MPVDLLSTPTGEVRVETGLGRVAALDVRAGKRNHSVEIDAEHLRIPLKAWVDGNDAELMARLERAYADGLHVCYRVEVKRKARAPIDVPIAELPKEDKVRDLADLVHVNGAGEPLQPLRHPPGAGADSAPSSEVAKPEAGQVSDPKPSLAERAAAHADAAPPAGPPAPPAGEQLPPLCPECGYSLRGADLAKRNGARVHKACPTQALASAFPGADVGDGPPRDPALRDPDEPPLDPELDGLPAGPTMREAGAAATAQREAQRRREAEPTRVCGLCDSAVPAAELGAHLDAHTKAAEANAAGAAAAGPPPSDPPTPPDPKLIRPSLRDRFGRGPRLAEAKPWEPTNTDGTLNLGSFVYSAALGMTELAAELLMERNRAAAVATGAELEAPTGPQIKSLARLLLRAADKAQAGIRPDGRIDRGDNSHTRARGAVRSALDWFPPPWGADAEHRGAWCDALADHAWTMLTVAVELIDPDSDLR